MSTFVVPTFQAEKGAEDVLTVINLLWQQLIAVDGSATVVGGSDEKPRVEAGHQPGGNLSLTTRTTRSRPSGVTVHRSELVDFRAEGSFCGLA